MLNRRLQILLDQERYDRLARAAQERGTSVALLVREAIDARYPEVDPGRDAAFRRIVEAEPMELPNDPAELKQEILDTRSKWG